MLRTLGSGAPHTNVHTVEAALGGYGRSIAVKGRWVTPVNADERIWDGIGEYITYDIVCCVAYHSVARRSYVYAVGTLESAILPSRRHR